LLTSIPSKVTIAYFSLIQRHLHFLAAKNLPRASSAKFNGFSRNDCFALIVITDAFRTPYNWSYIEILPGMHDKFLVYLLVHVIDSAICSLNFFQTANAIAGVFIGLQPILQRKYSKFKQYCYPCERLHHHTASTCPPSPPCKCCICRTLEKRSAANRHFTSRPVILRNITVSRLHLLVDCQGGSTLQFIRHTAIIPEVIVMQPGLGIVILPRKPEIEHERAQTGRILIGQAGVERFGPPGTYHLVVAGPGDLPWRAQRIGMNIVNIQR
jgi:hypothetical protein